MLCIFYILLLYKPGVAEVKRYAPDGAEGDDGVDDPRDQPCGAAEEIGYKVEAENPDETPVDAADYQKKEGDSIQYFHHFHPFVQSFA